jgi:hypothetical protein
MSENGDNLEETLSKARKFDQNKIIRKSNLNIRKPHYDPYWRKTDTIAELTLKEIDKFADELSGSREEEKYIYGMRI